MVQHDQSLLNLSFAALADAIRRAVLKRLGGADASITELAQAFDMTVTGMKKHVAVMEQAGLITSEKLGHVRTCRLGPGRLEDEAAWIGVYRQIWAARFDALDTVVEDLQRQKKTNATKPK